MTLQNVSENLLVKQAKNGNDVAFAELYNRNKNYIIDCIKSKFPKVSCPEDYLQDAFEQAFKKIHTFKEKSRFRTWVYKITYNIVIGEMRMKKNNIQQIPINDKMNNKLGVSPYESPREELENKTMLSVIEKCIYKLPKRKRDICSKFFLENMDEEEIAKRLGCSKQNVYSHIFASRKILSAHLKKAGYGNEFTKYSKAS